MVNISKIATRPVAALRRRVGQVSRPLIRQIKPVKVNLFIIGIQKAGTRSLWKYLISDDRIVPGRQKEVNFFRAPGVYERGEGWYHSQFEPPLRRVLTNKQVFYIDATPGYIRVPAVPSRLKKYNPTARQILVLREPVSRAYSAWNMYRQHSEFSTERKRWLVNKYLRGYNPDRIRSFIELINADPFPTFTEMVEKDLETIDEGDYSDWNGVVRAGLYAEQLNNWLNHFSRRDIYITSSQHLKQKPAQVLSEIYEHLKIEPPSLTPGSFEKHHMGQYPAEMSNEVRHELRQFYFTHNERLFELIGESYDW